MTSSTWRHGLPPGGRTPENNKIYQWRRNTEGNWMYRKRRSDIVAELDAELALIEALPYRVPIHVLAKRARDEIVALRDELTMARADWNNEIRKRREIENVRKVTLTGDRDPTDRSVRDETLP